MGTIVPAVLPKSREDLEETLARFASVEGIEAVQIDVTDGRFVAPATWPYAPSHEGSGQTLAQGETLPWFERFRFDIDLMVTNPEAVVGAWIAAGAARLTVHTESTTYLPKLIADLRNVYGHEPGLTERALSFGLALGIETDLALLEQYLESVDYVQFMGIAKIGKQGQPFDERVLSKIKTFHRKYPHILIQIDGGVSLTTAPLLLKAGARRLVVGSALLRAPDLQEEFNKFETLANSVALYE